jgi:hypothetical protein
VNKGSWEDKYVRADSIRNVLLKIGIILLAAFLIMAALFFTTTKLAFASDPEYVNWQQYPTNPVFDPAERVYYPSIIFDGSTYHMWYDDGSGTRYTTSSDGISWAAGTSVTGLTNARHAVVNWIGTKYMVWYWNSTQLYSINDIRTAESVNGINWTSDAPITQVGTTVIAGNPGVNWNAGSYGPCEVFYNAAGSATIVVPVDAATVWQNKFVIYYDGTTGAYEDIGIAVSADGKQWQGYNGGVAAVLVHGGSGWDSNFATFCSIQKIGGVYHMWYSGGQAASNEGIGYAQSVDGISWTKYASNPIMHKNDGVIWRSSRTYTPRVLYDAAGFSGAGEAAQLKMWYNGTDGFGNYALGYARITITTPTPTSLVTVGGRVNPVNKIAVLTPYLSILSAIAAVIVVSRIVWKKSLFVRISNRKH